MKYFIKSLVLVTTVMLLSCNQEKKKEVAPSEQTIEVIHALDTTNVVLKPERVVVFDMGTLETLNELDIKITGMPKDYVPEHLSKFGKDESIINVGSVKEPNLEKVNALNPDLIVISARLEKYYDELSKIAPTIYLQVDAKDYLNSFEQNTLTLGKIFGKEKEAGEKVEAIKNKIMKDLPTIEKDQKKALVLLYNNGKFSAYGRNSRFGFIHDVMKVKPVSESLEIATHGQPVSNEFIEHENPDYIFIVDRSSMVNNLKTNKNDIENALIKRTNAYKNNKIIYLDPQIWYLSGGGITSTNKMIEDIEKAVL